MTPTTCAITALPGTEKVGEDCRLIRRQKAGSLGASATMRKVWTEAGRRPGWSTQYTVAGCRLRCRELLDQADNRGRGAAETIQRLFASTSHVAVYVSDGDGGRIGQGVRLVAHLLRRILARGCRPPVDPVVEEAILHLAGLASFRRPSRHPGEIAGTLADEAQLPAYREIAAAAMFRERFSFDSRARLRGEQPLLHPDAEEPFLCSWVPSVLGDVAGHWILPQAPFSALTRASSAERDDRRLDFLLAHPACPTLAVEVDGTPHRDGRAVDTMRDAYLAAAGIRTARIPASAILAEGEAMREIVQAWRAPSPEPPSRQALLLTWGPAVAHRIALGIVEAYERGWFGSNQNVLRIDEPLGIAVASATAAIELLDAVEAIHGFRYVPERLQVVASGHSADIVRLKRGRYDVARLSEAPQDEAHVAHIVVQPFHGPFHVLPADARSTVVIRSTYLPNEPFDDLLFGGDRTLVDDPDAPPSSALKKVLQAVFGKRDFQPDGAEPRAQESAIRRLLAGKDTVVLLPTGGGKSMIYQMAGMLMPGLTLVVDPIVALIEDQLDGLNSQGIERAMGITSIDTAAGAIDEKLRSIRTGEAFFAFVAPERLQQRSFRDSLRSMTSANCLNLAVVDEAHCVSEWGHDFRTAYLDLGRVLRSVGADNTDRPPPILGLTGTASRTVLRDLLVELGIERADPEAIISPTSFDRPELRFEIVRANDSELLPRLAGALRALPRKYEDPSVPQRPREFFQLRGDDSCCGVVFCQTVNDRNSGVVTVAKALANELSEDVRLFAGSTPRGWKGDFDALKRRNARDFKRNAAALLVATKAYGMGIDKPNIRYVVHVGIPGSIEAYYQEAGRAGRDRREAQCVIVHTPGDRDVHEFFHGENYHGVERDLADVESLVDLLQGLGREGTIRIPMAAERARREKAIHRLKLLGLVRDYLVDWGGKQFELHLSTATPDTIDQALLDVVRRHQPARVAAMQRVIAGITHASLRGRVLQHSRTLISYVYETVAASRARAVEEMIGLAERCRSDEEIRQRILAYLELGQLARRLSDLTDTAPFEFGAWLELYQDITTADDAREWRGATARLLESAPDNPGLLVGRGLAEALAGNGDDGVFGTSIARALVVARMKFDVPMDDVRNAVHFLVHWTWARRPGWVAVLYLAAEKAVGTNDKLMIALQRDWMARPDHTDADEAAIVAALRLERYANWIETLADRHRRELS
jgi:ATP-dependent DNA helicase RecQ